MHIDPLQEVTKRDTAPSSVSSTQNYLSYIKSFFSNKKTGQRLVPVVGVLILILVALVGVVTYLQSSSVDNRTQATSDRRGRTFTEKVYPLGKDQFVAYFYNTHFANQPNPPVDITINNWDANPQFYSTPNPSSNFPVIQKGDSTWTFDTAKSGVIFQIPEEARKNGFYKIEATIQEPNYPNTFYAYIKAMDDLIVPGTEVNGITAGLKDDSTNYTLFFETTDRTKQAAIKSDTFTAAEKAHNDRFTRWIPLSLDTSWQKTEAQARIPRKIKFEIYVTPLGMYTVMDGYNMSGIPGDYIGGPLQTNTNPKYVYIGKFSLPESAKIDNHSVAVRQQAVFSDIKVTALDNTVSTVSDVNMYFISKFVNEGGPEKFRALQSATQYKLSFSQALWAADALRIYDHYYGTNHQSEVLEFARYALDDPTSGYKAFIDLNLPQYALATSTWQTSLAAYYKCLEIRDTVKRDICEKNRVKSTVDVNHTLINNLNIALFQVAIVDDYLTDELRSSYMNTFAPVIDESMKYIKGDGTFPPSGDWHIGDTFMEEFAWLHTLYAGYAGLYYNSDTSATRIAYLLDYLTFINTHIYSKGQSMNETLADYTFNYLDESLLDYKIRTIHDDGTIDNHNFSPSVNYGTVGSGVASQRFLARFGLNLPKGQDHTKQIFDTVTKRNLDLTTLKHKSTTVTKTVIDPRDTQKNPIVFPVDHYATIPQEHATYMGQYWKAFINYDFYGRIKPGLLEDWGNSFTMYHVPEMLGDYQYANQHAQAVYYLNHSSTGRFFCSHTLFASCFDFPKFKNEDMVYPGKLDYLLAEAVFAEYFSSLADFPKVSHPLSLTASLISSTGESTNYEKIILKSVASIQSASADKTKVKLILNPPLEGVIDIGISESKITQLVANKGIVEIPREYLPMTAGNYELRARRGVASQYYLTGPAWSASIPVEVQQSDEEATAPVEATAPPTTPPTTVPESVIESPLSCIPWTKFPGRKITTNAPTQQYGAFMEQAEYITADGSILYQAVWEANLGLIREVPINPQKGYAPDFLGLKPPIGNFDLKALAKSLVGDENSLVQANSATTIPNDKTAQIIWIGNTAFRRVGFNTSLEKVAQTLDQYAPFCAGKRVEAASLWQGYTNRQFTHIVEHLLCVNQDGSNDVGFIREIPLKNDTVAWANASDWKPVTPLFDQGSTTSKLESTSAEIIYNPNGPKMQIGGRSADDYPYGALLQTEWRYTIATDNHVGYLQYVPLKVDGTPDWSRSCNQAQ